MRRWNPGLGSFIVLGGIAAAAIGLYVWSRKKAVAAPAPVAPGSTPPAASPSDLAPPADGGIIDVQGLGYFSTGRQRIRRVPNRFN